MRFEPALVSGAIQALLALLIAFGMDLSAEQVGAILAAIAAVMAMFVRQAVTPVAKLEDEPGHD